MAGEKTGPNPTDRAKRGVKRSLLTEGHGVPVGLVIAGANRPDLKLVTETLESLVLKRPRPTKKRPQGMCLDKGYDYAEVRDTLKEFGFTAHIRARGEEAQALKRHAGARARRWVVERTHSLDESFSPGVDSLGQKRRELSRLPPLCLCTYRLPGRRVIRIGT